MNRRSRLPGADELFRATAGTTQAAVLAEVTTDPDVRPARGGVAHRSEPAITAAVSGVDETWDDDATPQVRPVRIARRHADARPTGRERHDEKITVYCSPEELMALEQARLTLRGSHRLAIDRGRIVREAVAVVIADLEAKGEASILVRRLRGR
jgi:hypothetical protein